MEVLSEQAAEGEPSMAEVARESPEKSVRPEHEVVGDGPDVGDLVPRDVLRRRALMASSDGVSWKDA